MRSRLRTVTRLGVLGLVLLMCGLLVPDSSPARTELVLTKVQHAEGVSSDPDTVWILAVGSDARPGEDMTRTRGDALQLVGMNSRTGAATAIGIPRDSYVSIPGVGSDRINAAMVYGGPSLLGRAVGDLVGVEPDYVVVTRFPLFEDMIDAIGGISVRNPRAFADPNLKPQGFEKGTITLDGYGAMAFSRVRKAFADGDFDRSLNQQRVLRGIQARIAERADQRGFMERGVLSVMRRMATDVGPAELFGLAQTIAQVDPRKITGCVVRGSYADVGGASVVLPFRDQALRYGNDARRDAVIDRC